MPKTEEQFRQMRDDMRSRILRESSLYFAKNGFGDTKISDLAKHIGIGQGTIYLYFKSKEELFEEIRKNADNTNEVKLIKALAKLPLSAAAKIERISAEVIKKLEDEDYAVKITSSFSSRIEACTRVRCTKHLRGSSKRDRRKAGW